MIDYAIHRLGYPEIRDIYPSIEIGDRELPSYVYMGFIDGMYAGYMAGTIINKDCIDIQCTVLLPEFRGAKISRILREMITVIHGDFYSILTRTENKNNNMLRVLLGAGFHIIGMRGDCVELERINE